MNSTSSDTIVAVSTPPGENGIGIVRLSGPRTLEIADKVFLPKSGVRPSTCKSHTIHYGCIVDGRRGPVRRSPQVAQTLQGRRRIDEVLVTVMRTPKTYTREDIVEINCHGGVVVVKEILDLILSLGARLAEPGEFTKRAFLNGRIDLAQAEAVLDIITSRTRDSLNIAQRQLGGELSQQMRKIRSKFLCIVAEIEADINFPDEELEVPHSGPLKASLIEARESLSELIEFSAQGQILREGITTVICGRPNVGKSSLMNSFLRHSRAIVTPVPGTTRDTIEEIVNVRGIPLRIVDTAGIIQAKDELTRESVERSMRYIEVADLVLLVLDSSDRLSKHDLDVIDKVKEKRTLVVINKTDLPELLQLDKIKDHLHNRRVIRVSAKDNSGLEELKDAIYSMFWSGEVTSENIVVSNARHLEAMRKALVHTDEALKGIDENRPLEFISVDVKDAVEALGAITGEVFTEDLLDAIFSNFCIGK